MWATFLSKWALYLLLIAVGVTIGMVAQQKLFPVEIPQCPSCVCPEPAVSLQPFDVDKIKGVKSFNYSPQFSGSISVAGVDSTALRKMFDKSIDAAFEKHSGKKRKR